MAAFCCDAGHRRTGRFRAGCGGQARDRTRCLGPRTTPSQGYGHADPPRHRFHRVSALDIHWIDRHRLRNVTARWSWSPAGQLFQPSRWRPAQFHVQVLVPGHAGRRRPGHRCLALRAVSEHTQQQPNLWRQDPQRWPVCGGTLAGCGSRACWIISLRCAGVALRQRSRRICFCAGGSCWKRWKFCRTASRSCGGSAWNCCQRLR